MKMREFYSYITGEYVNCYILSPKTAEKSYYEWKNNYGLQWVRTFFNNDYKIQEMERKDGRRLYIASLI